MPTDVQRLQLTARKAALQVPFVLVFSANGIVLQHGLPAWVADTDIEAILSALNSRLALALPVDLAEQRVPWRNQSPPFTIDAVWREQLLTGWADVQVTQSFAGAISAFKAADAGARPWMRPAEGG